MCTWRGTHTTPRCEKSVAPPYSPQRANETFREIVLHLPRRWTSAARWTINLSPREKQFTFVIRFQYFSKMRCSHKREVKLPLGDTDRIDTFNLRTRFGATETIYHVWGIRAKLNRRFRKCAKSKILDCCRLIRNSFLKSALPLWSVICPQRPAPLLYIIRHQRIILSRPEKRDMISSDG